MGAGPSLRFGLFQPLRGFHIELADGSGTARLRRLPFGLSLRSSELAPAALGSNPRPPVLNQQSTNQVLYQLS